MFACGISHSCMQLSVFQIVFFFIILARLRPISIKSFKEKIAMDSIFVKTSIDHFQLTFWINTTDDFYFSYCIWNYFPCIFNIIFVFKDQIQENVFSFIFISDSVENFNITFFML